LQTFTSPPSATAVARTSLKDDGEVPTKLLQQSELVRLKNFSQEGLMTVIQKHAITDNRDSRRRSVEQRDGHARWVVPSPIIEAVNNGRVLPKSERPLLGGFVLT
jgi:hypothetical protein